MIIFAPNENFQQLLLLLQRIIFNSSKEFGTDKRPWHKIFFNHLALNSQIIQKVDLKLTLLLSYYVLFNKIRCLSDRNRNHLLIADLHKIEFRNLARSFVDWISGFDKIACHFKLRIEHDWKGIDYSHNLLRRIFLRNLSKRIQLILLLFLLLFLCLNLSLANIVKSSTLPFDDLTIFLQYLKNIFSWNMF